MEKNFIIKDDLMKTCFMGEVLNISDPLKQGRVKVKVWGKFDDLEEEDIPWAYPSLNNIYGSKSGSGSFSLPKLNSIVNVEFDNGNLYHPIYTYNVKISDKILEQLDDDNEYENAQILLFDDEQEIGVLRIWYTPKNGLKLELDKSIINLKDDKSIIIQSDGGKMLHIKKDEISIGSEDKSDEPAVLGDKLVDALNAICDKISSLCDKISGFATTESSAASAAYILSPLSAGFAKLIADVNVIKGQILQIKNTNIPKVRSKTITIDGPPKI